MENKLDNVLKKQKMKHLNIKCETEALQFKRVPIENNTQLPISNCCRNIIIILSVIILFIIISLVFIIFKVSNEMKSKLLEKENEINDMKRQLNTENKEKDNLNEKISSSTS